eukprot:11341278-Alexandrium_andersonii.AAC.1
MPARMAFARSSAPGGWLKQLLILLGPRSEIRACQRAATSGEGLKEPTAMLCGLARGLPRKADT